MKYQSTVRFLSVLCILSMLLGAVGIPTLAAQADAGWTAYNDVIYRSSDQYIGANVTTFGIGNGFTGSTAGELLDQATGTPTGVTATLTQSGGVTWQPDPANGGHDTAVGTDAYSTFHGFADMTGVVYYGSSAGWYVDLTLTGLDPARQYTFATSSARSNNTYMARVSRYTLSGVDAATNTSTAGVTVVSNLSVAFVTGDNNDAGYVARWTGIQPGADGSFTIRAEAHTSEYRAYAFDVFMLQEEASASTPTITLTGTLNAFTSQPGAASAEQSYSVAGSGLTENIVIAAPADFEVSTTSGSGFGSSVTLTQSGGAVAVTPIFVRFNRATEGTSSGNITHVSAGATTQNVAVSGTATLPATPTLPINTGSTWKYLDNGSDQGTAWKEIAFSDASWASGPAELGYGDGGEATVVDCSAVANCNTNNYITTYFRKAFTVADRSIYSGLNLRLLRDDGAVVYLNGTEIWRTNMPTGTVSSTTLSPVAIGGTDETTFVNPPASLANTLLNGTNVLAVEIHQQAITSTDISFDLELTGVLAGPTCYALTLGHTGNGTTPTATPANSTGCSTGQYVSGETISLSGATPDSGWQIASWYGTGNDSSTASTNALMMPAGALSAGANYAEVPSAGLVCESFNSFTPGSTIGTYTGWYDGGSGPVVTSGNGVLNSIGLAAAANIYTWTAHPFNWNDPSFLSVTLQQDFRTDGAGQFDDDRMAWTTSSNSTDSQYQFGVQLDHPDGGIVTYWRTSSDVRIQTPIVTLPALTANIWYRFNAKITKLTATSAKIDVSLVQLDASGNPTGTPYTGTVTDTSTWSGGAPATRYFTATSMWPSYKTYNAAASAPADNACYEVVAGQPPVQHTLTANTVGSGTVGLSPSGGIYNEGAVVQLNASPAVGWAFTGWSGDLTGSTNPASITMDVNKTVTATFTQLPPVTLAVNTVGSGSVTLNPAGGSYAVGTVVQLTAAPAANWSFSAWTGDLSVTANPVSITMDANKTVTATFVEGPPPPAGTCESFESGFTLGQVVGTHAEWFDSGAGPVVTAGVGLANSIGLAPGSSIFTWTQHPFNWNDPAFESITFSMDYQTNASGEFDDDRLGWMTTSTGTDSTTFFGVQLDTTEDGGIVTFWRNAAGTRIQTPIVPAASFTADTWYRFDARFTKLTATSARIDVKLTQLDASGNPTGTPITGILDDTSTWPDGTPPDTYFTPTSMWPAYKNHNAITGAADNACFDILSGRFAFVVTTDWHTSDTYPNGGITTKVGQIANWVNNPTSSMPAPEFMVVTGDFPHLSQTDDVINNVLGSNFLWYPVIGNHEIQDNINNFYTIRDTFVPSLPNVVNNGPAGSLNTTYSFDYENAHFVVINPFWDGASDDHTNEGDIPSALNAWINTDLTVNAETHKFVFMHTPAFPSNRHVGEDLDAPANQGRRDAFVATLNANNVETLFSGHTHYYEHDVAPEYPLGNLDQVTNGALRSGETSTITYVLVEGNTTTYKVYMWNGSAFTLHEQWTIGETSPTQPPAAPTTLTASAVAYNQINLTWNDNSDNETGFEIERSTTGSGGPFTPLTTVLTDAEAYSNSGLNAENEYCYRVRAVNGAGQSTYTNVACATTPEQPPVTLTCDSFDSYTPGSTLGTYPGWYDGGSGPIVSPGNGVLNSVGLAAATNIYNWTTHPFSWNDPTFNSVTLQQDFRTDSAGQFDDDRMSWTTVSNSIDSLNQFGVQLDHPDGGIVTYWRDNSDVRVQTPIVTLPTLPANTWYRFNARITRLTATSAQIDVTLTQLDASGNPTGTPYAGTLANTSTWAGGAPATRYFTATTMWPSYKNFNSAAAAPADNACYQIVTGTPPPQYNLTVNVNPSGAGSVTLNPTGGLYYEGTIVQLTANPASGYAFNGWTGDLTGSANPTSIAMTGNRNVTANFIQQTGDLVGYWKFDAGSGTTATDSSTYGNNSSINGATWTTGRVNGGLSFDGSNDYVQVPNSSSLSLSTNRFTFAGWIYPNSTSADWTTIAQKSNTDGSWFNWQFYARAADAPTPFHPVFRVDWNQNGTIDAGEQVEGNIVLQANTWYFLTATYDGTALRFYIDGTLRGTTNISGGTVPASNRPIWLGGNDAWGEYFPGKIDEFRIYNRALSQAEIQTILNPPTCYALTLSHTGTGSNPVASPANSNGCPAGQYVAGAAINLSSAAPGTGWQISSWTGTNNNSSTASTNTVTMPASAHTAGVSYTQIPYTLTVNIVGDGTVAKNPNQATYYYGDIVQLTAMPSAGWSFSAWSGDLTGTTNPASITINGNKTVTATFTQDQYTLTVTSAHGAVVKNPDKATYIYGEVVQLTATADSGWSFANWSGDATGSNNPVSVTMDGNKSVSANYTQNQYTLAVTSANGTVTKNPDKSTYTHGEVVQLTAAPNAGWSFANWSGDATGTANPVSVTMDANKLVTANYTQNEYTLNVTVVGNGIVNKSPDQATYHYGDLVQLSAVPNAGWLFSNWSGDASGTTSPVAVTMEGNKNVTATFLNSMLILGQPSGSLTSWDKSFHWTGFVGPTYYLVEVQNTSGAVLKRKWFSATSSCNASYNCSAIYADINLPNGNYKWRMQDYGSYGSGAFTPLQDFTLNIPYTMVLGQPAGTLTSWDKSFHWTGFVGPTYYLVEVQNTSGTVLKRKWFSAAASCDASYNCSAIYTDINLPNGSYKWRMQDYGAYGYGSFTPLQDFTLNVPYAISLGQPAGTLTSWDKSFHWTGFVGPTYYLVEVQNPSGTVLKRRWFSAASSCDASYNCSASYADINLPNGSYKWRMQDYGAYGSGAFTALQDFSLNIPHAVVLGAPSGTLTSWDNSFSWTGFVGPTYYLVEVQSLSGTVLRRKWFSAATSCDASYHCTVSYADINLANGSYKWRMQDYGTYGYGLYTALQNFTLNLE